MNDTTDPAVDVIKLERRANAYGRTRNWRQTVRDVKLLGGAALVVCGLLGGALHFFGNYATKHDLAEVSREMHLELHQIANLIRPGVAEEIHNEAARSREE